MKTFKLEVPEGKTLCFDCPFYLGTKNNTVKDICQYCQENNICFKYDLTKMHIWE